jgi:Skp family chaperone for outer membrane proteins
MRKMTRSLAGALFGALLVLGVPLGAQQSQGLFNSGGVKSLILTVSPERLYTESDFGKRITREIEEEGASIAAENRQIEAELTAEERELTDLRDTLDPTDFRARANAFDEKVQERRREQDEKARTLGQRSEEARRALLLAAQPILSQLMLESGAVAILDRRAVLLSADAVDITEKAIIRVNARIGDGADIFPIRQ